MRFSASWHSIKPFEVFTFSPRGSHAAGVKIDASVTRLASVMCEGRMISGERRMY